MTRKRMHYAECEECRVPAICPECGKPVAASTPFSDWLRGLGGPLTSQFISLHNLDFIWHNYRQNWLITIEEKRNGATCSFAQRDTHGIVAQMLKIASGSTVTNARNRRMVIEYRGHYVTVFDKSTPENGGLSINGVRRTKDDLMRLLSTGRDPEGFDG